VAVSFADEEEYDGVLALVLAKNLPFLPSGVNPKHPRVVRWVTSPSKPFPAGQLATEPLLMDAHILDLPSAVLVRVCVCVCRVLERIKAEAGELVGYETIRKYTKVSPSELRTPTSGGVFL
jgi:hypothetical protein